MQRLGDMREKEAPTIGEYITVDFVRRRALAGWTRHRVPRDRHLNRHVTGFLVNDPYGSIS